MSDTKSTSSAPAQLSFDPGELVILEFLTRERVRCTLIGYECGEYLILRVPGAPLLHTKFRHGNRVTIRYAHKGRVFGFHTDIVELVTRPFPHLFLVWPEAQESQSLRGSERVEAFISAEIGIRGHKLKGMIRDISSGGCLFMTDKSRSPLDSISEDDEVDLFFSLAGCDTAFSVAGRVQKVHRRDDGRMALGIRFHELNEEALGAIGEYVRSVLEYIE